TVPDDQKVLTPYHLGELANGLMLKLGMRPMFNREVTMVDRAGPPITFGGKLQARELDFRVATSGSMAGEKLVMRILDNSGAISKLEDLGMRPKMVEQVRSLVTQPHGMFLCCGPTGSGKSTTLYASLHEIDRYQRNIITVEDPIEYHMDNLTQMEVNTKAGQTFAIALRSILRQDPDVIMIGEIRDQETARIACQAANTGHMVFSTVHSN